MAAFINGATGHAEDWLPSKYMSEEEQEAQASRNFAKLERKETPRMGPTEQELLTERMKKADETMRFFRKWIAASIGMELDSIAKAYADKLYKAVSDNPNGFDDLCLKTKQEASDYTVWNKRDL